MVIEKQLVRRESLEDRFKRYLTMFQVGPVELKDMYDAMLSEIASSLKHHKDPSKYPPTSMKFLDTCVVRPPSGNEIGTFYAVDFGGTNLRAVRVTLDGQRNLESQSTSINIRASQVGSQYPKGLLDEEAPATLLFDEIAVLLKRAMKESEGEKMVDGPDATVGFTFSFPMVQRAINSGTCVTWTKGFETGRRTEDPVEGVDVCLLLDMALRRNQVPAHVVAALNDTTGTLISAAYECGSNHPAVGVGLIVGTGMNACYVEPAFDAFGYTGRIINTELGGFNCKLPINIIDNEVDFASTNRTEQSLEKMCSGLYLPEICRRLILKVYQNEAPRDAWVHNTLTTEGCSLIAHDDSETLSDVQETLNTLLEWNVSDLSTLRQIRTLFAAVFERSAALVAVVIASLATQSGRLQRAAGGISVGIDGSLYIKSMKYKADIRTYLATVLGESRASLIETVTARDGSGIGAGILAAVSGNGKRRESFRINPF